MTSFADATRLRAESGSFVWDVPDGWQQGRGAWGGLAVGALARAVAATEPDPRRTVRSISAQLMAPALTVSHRVSVTPLRAGSSMTTWSATAFGKGDEVVATGVVITGGPRTRDATDHAEWGVAAMPAAPAPADVPRIHSGPPFPTFAQNFAYRPISGMPISSAPAETLGWLAYDVATPWDAASLLALVDGWWTANVVRTSGMPRIATVNFLATLLVDPSSLAPGEPLLSHAYVAGAHDGFTSEHRRLWAADGRLVVDNLQTIVVGA